MVNSLLEMVNHFAPQTNLTERYISPKILLIHGADEEG
jgi:hypothetical protein